MHSITQSHWKHFCKTHYVLLSSICYDSIAQISMHILRTMFAGRLISHWGAITWLACLTDFTVGLYQKQGIQNISCQNSWPKTVNLEVYSRICFPSQLQKCTEWHGGHLESIRFKQQWFRWILMDMEYTC